MFFVNMLDERGKGQFRRSRVRGEQASVFVNEYEEGESPIGGIIADGKYIRVIGENNSATASLLGKMVDPLKEHTEAQLADTDENPVIWVLTDEVSFLCGTSNLFKMLPINDDMFLFCLVKGVCGIGKDQTMLTRCIPPISEREVITYKPADLYSLCGAKDSDIGYCMTYDSVPYMRLSITRDGMGVSTKTFMEYTTILSTEGAKKEKERIEEAKRRAEERRKAQEEARRLAEAKAKAEQAEEEKIGDLGATPFQGNMSSRVKDPMKKKKNSDVSYSNSNNRSEISVGASAFMSFVRQQKGE